MQGSSGLCSAPNYQGQCLGFLEEESWKQYRSVVQHCPAPAGLPKRQDDHYDKFLLCLWVRASPRRYITHNSYPGKLILE